MDGKEDPPPPPPLSPPNNQSYLFTPPFPSTTLQRPPLLYPNSAPQPQLLPDIDWVSLLSCPTWLSDTKPLSGTAFVASTSQTTANEGIKYDRDRRSGSRLRKATRPRFAFQTRSADDILDDGYRWRKYGQKAVKNSIYPRSYYRCTHHTCSVKKQVQRQPKDSGIVVTTYEGIHNHPCVKLMETLSPLLKQMQFLSRF